MEISKKKLTDKKEGGYSPYDDGRLTYLIEIEPNSYDPEDKTKNLYISHQKGYASGTGSLNLQDLKALRKLIRKAIRNYESDESFQI